VQWRFSWCTFSKWFQVLGPVVLPLGGQTEVEERGVVVDHVEQRGETAVVEEAALAVREESLQRRGAVLLVGRALRLELIDADLRSGMHVPAGLREQRLHVAVAAFRLAVEKVVAGRGRSGSE